LDTRTAELVYATIRDRFLGIGYVEDEALLIKKEDWGWNFLGEGLIEVRRLLRELRDIPNPEA
jgi:predicted NAD-dependent protein-ADP-ribosyltransferase YbiA (DUF1768 family)